MKVRELSAALAECDDQEAEVRVALELGWIDSVSLHTIHEVDGSADGVELIIDNADELLWSPSWLGPVLLGEADCHVLAADGRGEESA